MIQSAFSRIRKNLKKERTGFPETKLVLLADCASQHLAEALCGTAYDHRIDLKVREADYNLIEEETRDPGSMLFRTDPDFVLLFLCTEKLYGEFSAFAPEKRRTFAEDTMSRIAGYWQRINQGTKAKILQFDFAEPDDGVYGNLAWKTEESFPFQIRKLNMLFSERTAGERNVFPVGLNALQTEYGRNTFHDPKLFAIARLPVRLEMLPELAEKVLKIVDACAGKIRKCAVLDLDNTLWGGVIGDDGPEGIRIGELADGRIYSEIQRYFKALKERGIILAVCSKNDETTALEPFRTHPEMILKEDDFAVFLANWNTKSENIRKIREILNIGMDSIVFIDDSPFEREEVRRNLPEITVPELPGQPEEILPFLRKADLFETCILSGEDASRTRQYRAEAERVKSSETFADYQEYLASLDMTAEVRPFDAFLAPRIAQLTQRSNQFNLRTVRYTQEEILAAGTDPGCLTLVFHLKDRFGDHGLIGVVILKKKDADTLFADTFLMSCRVLKRGMEEFMMNTLIKQAAERGFAFVEGEYLPTAKNGMVRDLYSRFGFAETEKKGLFRMETARYRPQKTWIKGAE